MASKEDSKKKTADGGTVGKPLSFPARELAAIKNAHGNVNEFLSETTAGVDEIVSELVEGLINEACIHAVATSRKALQSNDFKRTLRKLTGYVDKAKEDQAKRKGLLSQLTASDHHGTKRSFDEMKTLVEAPLADNAAAATSEGDEGYETDYSEINDDDIEVRVLDPDYAESEALSGDSESDSNQDYEIDEDDEEDDEEEEDEDEDEDENANGDDEYDDDSQITKQFPNQAHLARYKTRAQQSI